MGYAKFQVSLTLLKELLNLPDGTEVIDVAPPDLLGAPSFTVFVYRPDFPDVKPPIDVHPCWQTYYQTAARFMGWDYPNKDAAKVGPGGE